MTQENKDLDLLFKDLCARLPYGVKCQFEDTIIDAGSGPFYDYVLSTHHLELFMKHNNFYIKPYLRPMSSMTEEETVEYNDLMLKTQVSEIYFPYFEDMISVFDWLNKKMFDFRGLIPKGLALSTDEFNPYED